MSVQVSSARCRSRQGRCRELTGYWFLGARRRTLAHGEQDVEHPERARLPSSACAMT